MVQIRQNILCELHNTFLEIRQGRTKKQAVHTAYPVNKRKRQGLLPLSYFYPAAFIMLSIKMPYPLVGSSIRTWVTAPISLPF